MIELVSYRPAAATLVRSRFKKEKGGRKGEGRDREKKLSLIQSNRESDSVWSWSDHTCGCIRLYLADDKPEQKREMNNYNGQM